jgi:hypothetical protein
MSSEQARVAREEISGKIAELAFNTDPRIAMTAYASLPGQKVTEEIVHHLVSLARNNGGEETEICATLIAHPATYSEAGESDMLWMWQTLKAESDLGNYTHRTRLRYLLNELGHRELFIHLTLRDILPGADNDSDWLEILSSLDYPDTPCRDTLEVASEGLLRIEYGVPISDQAWHELHDLACALTRTSGNRDLFETVSRLYISNIYGGSFPYMKPWDESLYPQSEWGPDAWQHAGVAQALHAGDYLKLMSEMVTENIVEKAARAHTFPEIQGVLSKDQQVEYSNVLARTHPESVPLLLDVVLPWVEDNEESILLLDLVQEIDNGNESRSLQRMVTHAVAYHHFWSSQTRDFLFTRDFVNIRDIPMPALRETVAFVVEQVDVFRELVPEMKTVFEGLRANWQGSINELITTCTETLKPATGLNSVTALDTQNQPQQIVDIALS